MIVFKNGLSQKEKKDISATLEDLVDLYGDFYITKNNLRLYIKENQDVLFDSIKKGDKIVFSDDGIAVVIGFSDNMNRKYVRILGRDEKSIVDLLKVINWNLKCDLYLKIKKNNPLRKIAESQGFKFAGGRGKEVLLSRRSKYTRQDKKC